MDKSKTFLLLNNLGQGAVEYILLILVITSILFAILKSRTFTDFVGNDSEVFRSFISTYRYSYRHGSIGRVEDDNSTYTDNHDSYVNPTEGRTRFFAPRDPYPN